MNNFTITLNRQPPHLQLNLINKYNNATLIIVIQGDKPLLESFKNIRLTQCDKQLDVDFLYKDGKFYAEINKKLLDCYITHVYAELKDMGGNKGILSQDVEFVKGEHLFIAKILPHDDVYEVILLKSEGRGDHFYHDYSH